MIAVVPETHKQPGICYAIADDGLELPVIDVTQPAFACELSDEQLSAQIDRFVQSLQAAAALPPGAMAAMAQKSRLMQGLVAMGGASYTSGMVTYLNKLGPDNLGEGYASPMDRQWAAGFTPLTFRWRMRDLARLLADGLAPALAARPDAPLLMVNIAGGPAADSWNALILLQKEHPDLLAGRRIRIYVLDVDAEGPDFGARALAALRAADGPLAGVDAAMEYIQYDWTQPQQLRILLRAIDAVQAVVAVSSEGGLFEYAADEQIVANLAVLAAETPADTIAAGPVVRDATTLDPRLVATEHVPGRPPIRYLGLTKFADLAARGGWQLATHLDGPMHQVVCLRK
jgi:hypothetical protein